MRLKIMKRKWRSLAAKATQRKWPQRGENRKLSRRQRKCWQTPSAVAILNGLAASWRNQLLKMTAAKAAQYRK
jgi:hypothetical protein